MSPSLVSLASRVHDLFLRPGHMDAARCLAEACLADREQGHVDALQFPLHPNFALYDLRRLDREGSFEGSPSMTPGQMALALAALHDVGCPHVEKVIVIPADAATVIPPPDPKVDRWMVSTDFGRAVRWREIRQRVDGLGDYGLDWFNPLLGSFERVLSESVPPLLAQAPVASLAGPPANSPPAGDTVETGDDPARHSDDFRSVHWYGKDYTFTRTQAACVGVLWRAWKAGTPELGQQTILEHPTVEAESDRLIDVFKQCPAWGKMIQKGTTSGAYRLVEPPFCD